MGVIKLLHRHLQRILEELISLDVLLFNFVEDAIGKIDHPVDGMLIGQAGEDLNCPVELDLCLFQLVYHHQVFGVIAVCDCI